MILRHLLLGVFLLTCLASVSAQESTITAEQLRMAREFMSDYEEELLRTGENQEASALILESRLANEAAYLFLVKVPGYDDAMKNDQLLEFMEETRKEYKDYRNLDKEAKKTRRKKQNHIATINDDYRKALELYDQAG